MFGRLGFWLSELVRRVVPSTYVLAILLSGFTALLCWSATPVGAGELLQIWLGQGSHPLMRSWGGKTQPWVVQKIERHSQGVYRLELWSKSPPGAVAKALAAKKFAVRRGKGRALFVRAERRELLEQALVATRIKGKIKGIWHFLAFAMQMCLILLGGYVIAVSGPVMAGVRRIAALPKSGGGAAALVAFVAMVCGWLNWGFGLIVGAYFAREVGRQGQARGIPMHYPLLGASGYAAMLIWHCGLSGSAPLKVAQAGHLSRELGLNLAPIPLTSTIFSPFNLLVSGALLLLIPLLCRALMPAQKLQPISDFVEHFPEDDASDDEAGTWLDRSYAMNLLLAVPMALFLLRFLWEHGAKLSINLVILLFLTLGLFLHADIRGFLKATHDGTRSCAGIMLQFPLYAGIFAMMYETGMVDVFASWVGQLSSVSLFYVANFLTAGLINVFVPSGGGQWGVQGAIALTAAQKLNAPAGMTVLTVAYGDQWTNMLQPFWALALLEITQLRARDLLGYTILLMLASGVVFVAFLLLAG